MSKPKVARQKPQRPQPPVYLSAVRPSPELLEFINRYGSMMDILGHAFASACEVDGKGSDQFRINHYGLIAGAIERVAQQEGELQGAKFAQTVMHYCQNRFGPFITMTSTDWLAQVNTERVG